MGGAAASTAIGEVKKVFKSKKDLVSELKTEIEQADNIQQFKSIFFKTLDLIEDTWNEIPEETKPEVKA